LESWPDFFLSSLGVFALFTSAGYVFRARYKKVRDWPHPIILGAGITAAGMVDRLVDWPDTATLAVYLAAFATLSILDRKRGKEGRRDK